MPRSIPKYRRHPNGQAFVYHASVASRDHRLYLGKHGSAESQRRYRQFLQRIEASATAAPSIGQLPNCPTIAELALLHDKHIRLYYQRPGGMRSAEYTSMVAAINYLLPVWGEELAINYGPKSLKGLQRLMASEVPARTPTRYARSHINHTTSRIKRFFRWACQEELIDPAVYERLRCVRGLNVGEYGVREAPRIPCASMESLRAILPFVAPVVGSLIQVQFYCGMRPSEACAMRPMDIDRSGDIWVYRPDSHKNAWRGKPLAKAIPRQAQVLLAPLLDQRDPAAYVFDPREAREWIARKMAELRRPRTTKWHPCESRSIAKAKQLRQRRKRTRASRELYDVGAYRQALNQGFERALRAGVEIKRFTPGQLRHSIVTLIAGRLGQQKAQRFIGHENLDTTSIYTEIHLAEMLDVARQMEGVFDSLE